ncbi:MAG: PASTA domain-containing protein [Cohaesibacter sp.]|jgi:beta-lactam-binding protein with PASTA domain|nr:PASTA domain-containing protein [Cohaesibacter sp.]
MMPFQFRPCQLSQRVLEFFSISRTDFSVFVSLVIAATLGAIQPLQAQLAARFEMNYQPMQANAQKCIPPLDAKAPPSYLSEFYDGISKSCSGEKLSEKDRLEYLVVTIGVLVPNPATPYLAAYGGSKFSGHMKDCLTEALINASAFSPEQKKTLKKTLADISTLKGWKEALQGLPELADRDQVDAMLEIAEEISDVRKKQGDDASGPNSQTIYQMLSSAYSNANHAQRLLRKGPVGSWLYDMDHAMDACRYDEAEKLLEKARIYTKQVCDRNGASLRVRERGYLAHMRQTRAKIERNFDGPERQKAAQLFYLIEASQRSIDYHLSNLEKIDERSKDLQAKRKSFKRQQKDYLELQNGILASLRKGGDCKSISDLEGILSQYPPSCQSAFFKRVGSAFMRPDDLYDRLVQNGRNQIRFWWAEADKVEGAYRACNIDKAERIKSALQSQIRARPVYLYDGARCNRLELTDLHSHLANQTFPDHCRKVDVPRVSGRSVSKASDLIYEANLVPGEVITLPNDKGQWQEDMVVKTSPEEGSKVRQQSRINLFKAGKKLSESTAQDLVTMPNVIGKPLATAENLVRAVGLVVITSSGVAANEESQTEGHVYLASHEANSPIEAGTAITLTYYKAATHGRVPAIAGKTIETAKSLLLAAGFQVTGPGLGKPAAESKDVGAVYGSQPGFNSRVLLGSPVEILLYGPSKGERVIPDVSGKAIDVAAGMIIGDDGFFVLGNIIDVSPIPEGGKENHVIRTEPAAGEFAPKGTLVTVYAYPDYQADNKETAADEREEGVLDAETSNMLDAPSPQEGTTSENSVKDRAFFYGYWKSKLEKPTAGRADHSIIVIERKVSDNKFYKGYEADFLEYWVPDDDGGHRRFLTLPVIVSSNGIVANAQVIEKAQSRQALEKKKKLQNDKLGLSKALKSLSNIGDMLKSLTIRYDNGQCFVSGQNKEGRTIQTSMHCEKLPGPVFLKGREG